MSDTPPDVPVMKARKSLLERVSVVWIVPLLALVIALAVAWQSYAERGPLVYIVFDDAAGISAGETELRYRDLAVGVVEQVGFTASLEQVRVGVRLDDDVADFVDADAEFWVVRPEVTAQGVTGLDTVLSGVFIEGIWDSDPGGFVEAHEGADIAPLNRSGRPGLMIRLRADADTNLADRAPIEFRGIEVGRLGTAVVSEDGSTVEADAIIYAPHDRLVTTATRFWDTSGFAFTIDAGGAELNFSSLASLFAGGISFGTVVSGGRPVEPGAVFSVYYDEATARASLFGDDDGGTLTFTAIFDQNVAGLIPNASIDYGGIQIGRVESINGIVSEARFGDSRVRLAVTMQVRPARLGLDDDTSVEEALAFFQSRVRDNGLRARLVRGSLLTGGLKVELATIENAEPAEIDLDAEPNPIFPTVPSEIADMTASAEGVLERISALPIEEVLQSAIDTMDSITALAASEDMRQVPAEVRALLGDARGIVGSEEMQALPVRVESAVAELDALLATLNEEEAAVRLLAAVDSLAAAADEVTASAEDVPALVQNLTTLTANAAEVPLAELAAQLDALLASADGLISGEAAQALPANLNAAITDLRGTLDEVDTIVATLNDQDAAGQMLAAVEDVTAAAAALAESANDLPALIAAVTEVAESASEVPLPELAANLDTLLVNADALIGGKAAQALPVSLNAALAELRGTIAGIDAIVATLNSEDAAARLLAAVDDVAAAAGNLAASTDGVPALIDSLNTVAANAGEVPLADLAAQLQTVLTSADTILSGEAAQALPASLNSAIGTLEGTIAEVDTLVATLNTEGAAARLLAAVDDVAAAAGNLAVSTDGVPALIDSLNTVAANAGEVPLAELAAQLQTVLTSADAILSGEAAQALPASLNSAIGTLEGTIAEVDTLVATLNTEGAAARLLAAVDDVAAAAGNLAASTDGVPALIDSLNTVAANAGDVPLGELSAQLQALLTNADSLVSGEAAQALPASLNGAITDLRGTIAEVDTLVATLNTEDAAARLLAAVDDVAAAAGNLAASTDGVPVLIDNLNAVAQEAGALPLTEVADQLTALLASADLLVSGESTQQLPATLGAALEQLRTTLAEVDTLVTGLNEDDASARLLAAVDEVAAAAGTLSTSAAGVPALIDRLNAIAATAEELPLEQVADQLSSLLATVDAMLGTEGARRLPESLAAALDQLRLVLAELQSGGVVENVNATLTSARSAAESIGNAADSLPALLGRTGALLDQAAVTLGEYGTDDGVGRSLAQTLREVEQAAAAISSLARELERNPNSLLFGR
ncbi:paraquat-inducible protein, putative [Oceanicola granulosus HTCC2516]|uniref:Paraquat-inducible protein, putative n=1 Tax=Oceanicola granulosus (strain ATCC BAA-861 / DSM 15982 / KCTC 12143 / HTCC2516) TaxID=314256 RepID=Q2CEX1_OCEGH|nr:MlaD family protein [Oceanicola granulosus]EAR51239.1 paraquat-inducible protein, putative [Oceanicola granulosus HTCC2516]